MTEGKVVAEWTSPIEGIHGNWEGELPTVYRWAYDYSKPGEEDDYILQTVPDEGQINPLVSPLMDPVPDGEKIEDVSVSFSILLKRWFGFNRGVA